MNPTEQQLANRLNPTAVTFNVPSTDGLFREATGQGGTIFRKVGNKIEQFDLTSLVSQQEKQALGNYGAQMELAKRRLKEQYGIDYNLLTGANLGDINSQGYNQGLQVASKAGPDGGVDNFFHSYSGDLTSFLGAKANSQATSVTVNNTPNTLATTGSTVSIQPPLTNLQPGSTGEDVKKLQDYLVSQGFMTQEQVNTGYGTYGPQTTAAVKALQEKLGVDNSSGVGYFGPKTIQAVTGTGGTTTSASTSGSSTTTGSSTQSAVLTALLNNSALTPDQKSLIQTLYTTVTTGDKSNAERIKAAFEAATAYSDPYFKAQTLIATDALDRALNAEGTDLAYNEKKLNETLKQLEETTASAKDYLSFQHQQELKKLSDSYKADLETTQQNLAATGKTSSSVRTKAESMLSEQNQGLVESSNRTFGYQTGNLDRSLAGKRTETESALKYLTDKDTQKRIDLLRQTEANVGSDVLSGLGYSGLLGGIGGEIPRKKTLDAMSFANSFVF